MRANNTGKPVLGHNLTRTGFLFVIFAVFSIIISFFILSGLTPLRPGPNVQTLLFIFNILIILILIGILGWSIVKLWRSWKNKEAGAELHIRLVTLFGVISLLPAIAMAVFASISVDNVLKHWFSSRTQAIIDNSIHVAQAYLNEHGQVIRSDTVAMSTDLKEALQKQSYETPKFIQLLTSQSALRALNMSYVINEKGEPLARAALTLNRSYQYPTPEHMTKASDGEVVIIPPTQTNVLRAIKRLSPESHAYLYVWRFIDPNIISHLQKTRQNVREYRDFAKKRSGIQIAFILLYVAIALTLLLAALWFALWLANRLVSPIRQLISASQKVADGDLDVRVKNQEKQGDIHDLSRTFNKMIGQLGQQRKELVNANSILDERRQLIEAVLAGVSSGVIGINEEKTIDLVNQSALKLLDVKRNALIGKKLNKAVPFLSQTFEEAEKKSRKSTYTKQIKVPIKGTDRNFAVSVTQEKSDVRKYGHVITFDDVTELVGAQRLSAWADIARRIAHEIKNPLTPIQLSAERLKRRYKDQIKDDDIFTKCTDTIIRQVGDIGRMVDEFSSFARTPKPKMEKHNIVEVIRESMLLYQLGQSHISFKTDLPSIKYQVTIDRRLISQAITNLVKNATEAVEARGLQENDKSFQGLVKIKLTTSDDHYIISVIDNGCGLPKKDRARLIEPYVTTRDKGTGLGLAIVQKIAEQHGGQVVLADIDPSSGETSGSEIQLVLPTYFEQKQDDETFLANIE